MRILITGSRDWTDIATVRRALEEHASADSVVVHGNARGADRIAANVAAQMGLEAEPHPAQWERYGRSAGYRRNAEMAELGADVCLAFPLGESRGTRMMMRLAQERGIDVVDYGADANADEGPSLL